MKQERAYAGIFAALLQDAEAQGYIRPGFNLTAIRMLWPRSDGDTVPDGT